MSFALKEPWLVKLVMVGGRKLIKVSPRNENDLSLYDAKRARGIEREVVVEDLKDRAGVLAERREEIHHGGEWRRETTAEGKSGGFEGLQ